VDADSLDDDYLSEVRCDALVKSIGYRSLQIDGVPFDKKTNTIPH